MQATMAAKIRLNWAAFDAACRQRGWHLNKERAQALGVSESMISRAQASNWSVSPRLMAACMAAFGTESFGAIFQVVES